MKKKIRKRTIISPRSPKGNLRNDRALSEGAFHLRPETLYFRFNGFKVLRADKFASASAETVKTKIERFDTHKKIQ